MQREEVLEQAQALGAAAWEDEQAGRLDAAGQGYREALALLAAAGEGEGDDAASLLHDLGSLCARGLQPAEAETHLRAARAIFEAQGDDGAADTGNVLLALANLYQSLGRYREAHASCQRAHGLFAGLVARLDGGEQVPPEVEATVRGLFRRSLGELSGVLVELGRYPEAEEAARQALELGRAQLPAEDPERVGLWNTLGVARKYRGDYDGAAQAYARALELLQEREGPEAAALYHNLAGLAHARGRFAEGEEPARQALALRTAQLGEDNPGLALDLHGLASILGSIGREEEATALYERAIALAERAYGEVHREVAVNLNNLAGLARKAGRLDEAEAHYRRALAIKLQLFGDGHPDVALAQYNLARTLQKRGTREEARRLLERAQAIAHATLDPSHPRRVAIAKACGELPPPG